MSRLVSAVFAAGFLFCAATAVYGAAINHGTEGVADTLVVSSVLQLTTNETSYDNYISGDDYPIYEEGFGNIQPWKQDGQWVVFTSEHGGTYQEHTEIAKIKTDGTTYTRLTNNSYMDSNGSFSSDNKIYFHAFNGSRRHLARMNADGSGWTDLSAAHGATTNERWPIVSPDGTKIAYIGYVAAPPYEYKLYVANADGTSPIDVTGVDALSNPIYLEGYRGGGYSWSPDSQWLVFSGNTPAESNRGRLFKVNADGSGHTQLTSDTETGPLPQHLLPALSPDGNVIAYWWTQYDGGDYHQLRTISASDGSPIRTVDLTTPAYPGWTQLYPVFSWSPDSQWIAYSKTYTGSDSFRASNALFIAQAYDETPPRQLTTGYWDYRPHWSPDGNKILFQALPSEGSYASRDSSCSPNCQGQIMLLNLTDNYGGSGSFPWHMFLPAIEANAR
jgi:Tol biopolymer transport system component